MVHAFTVSQQALGAEIVQTFPRVGQQNLLKVVILQSTGKLKVGDKVNIGDLLAILEGAAGAAVPAPAAAPAQAVAPVAAVAAAVSPAAAPADNPTATTALGLPQASPSVRKFARELGVPLAEVPVNGPKGCIILDDVQSFKKSVMAGAVQTAAQKAKAPAASAGGGGSELDLIHWPKVAFAKFGLIERKEIRRIKKISGANLLRNGVMTPAVTNQNDADITDLEAFRVFTNKENEKSGAKVTMLAFQIKAITARGWRKSITWSMRERKKSSLAGQESSMTELPENCPYWKTNWGFRPSAITPTAQTSCGFRGVFSDDQ